MTETEDRVISRSQNVVIADGDWGPVVPYPAADRGDDGTNHGYFHLRDDLALQIPEAREYPELGMLLKAINSGPSPLFSIGCDCGYFPYKQQTAAGITTYLSCYIDIAFHELERNRVKEEVLNLANEIARPFEQLTDPWTQLEIELQRAKGLFSCFDCWMLQTKVMGFGSDKDAAQQTWTRGIRGYQLGVEGLSPAA